MIMPGVQKPHWTPPVSMNACWTGWSFPFVARPSTVTTSRPSAWAASIRQEVTSRPSTIIEQAPQSPVPQPSFDPVNRSSSRTISSSVQRGSTATSYRAAVDGEGYELLRHLSGVLSSSSSLIHTVPGP